MGVWRKGELIELEATISEATSPPLYSRITPEEKTKDNLLILKNMGIEVRELAAAERALGYVGVLVTDILPEGKAKGILQPGDLIVSLNGSRMTNAKEFYLHLAASAAVQATSLSVIRSGAPLRLSLPPP